MRHIILQGHIFKNAGTTFDWSLARNFGVGFLDHRDDEKMLANGCEHLAKLVQDDPALKAVSSHHVTRMFPETPGAVAARNKSFRDYISRRMQDDVHPMIRNYQTRYLAGRRGICPEREVYESQFARAVEWLGSAKAGMALAKQPTSATNRSRHCSTSSSKRTSLPLWTNWFSRANSCPTMFTGSSRPT